jgi:hypothetical protein
MPGPLLFVYFMGGGGTWGWEGNCVRVRVERVSYVRIILIVGLQKPATSKNVGYKYDLFEGSSIFCA